jgi:hypothetical protein
LTKNPQNHPLAVEKKPFIYDSEKLQIGTDSSGSDGIHFRTYFHGYADRVVIEANGKVGIGTTVPAGGLHCVAADSVLVLETSAASAAATALTLRRGGSYQWNLDLGGDNDLSLYSYGTGRSEFHIQNDSGNVGIGTRALHAKLEVQGSAVVYGNVGIGTTSPTARLHIDNEANTYELLLNNTFGPGASLAFQQNGTTRGGMGVTGRWKGDTSSDLGIWAVGGTRLAFYSGGSGTERMVIDTGGNVGIGTTSPQAKLDVAGSAAFENLRINHPTLGKAYLVLQNSGVQAGFFGLSGVWKGDSSSDTSMMAETGYGLRFYSDGSATERMVIDTNGNVGIGTTDPQAKLHVSGEILTKAVNITAGADISEPFPVTGPDIPKGAVVVIDDTQPGQLKLSDRAYDTRVAGIVSGAGGVNSGLTLRQEGALEGNHNVALTGRVYALADATATPIQPGDLLTTADSPGHCMKVTDREKANGAILGKAMSGLKEGKGLILVLVALQ